MDQQRRGIAFAFAGVVLLAVNIIDLVDRGESGANIIALAIGISLLFYGFTSITRPPKP